jgi:hypothetical protein
VDDFSTDTVNISSDRGDPTTQSGTTNYDLHSMTHGQMWDLAGKLGLDDSLRMYTITHPMQVSADGTPSNNPAAGGQKIDFLQLLPAMLAFDKSSGSTTASTQDQFILNTLKGAADQNGIVAASATPQR